MDKECKKEPIGSDEGAVLLTVIKAKGGIKMETAGTPWELLNIAATLIDTVAVNTQTSIEDTIGAFIEILAQNSTKD